MRLTKKQAKQNLSRLVQKFQRELEAGQIERYNEEATKISFIQPLLQDVLGWDVRDHDEVSPEEKVSRGRVDYGLKIVGATRIFVEAKPIKADLRRHIEQAVGYGYNRRSVPFVLLTDFEEFKVFDVTIKPDSRNLSKGLKIDLRWDCYLENFEDLWLLSKESVEKGRLDKLLLIKPKDRVPVDKAILDDLKRWRVALAKDIFRHNPELFHSDTPQKDAAYLREITQRMLDRIMFMRFSEDRGLVHRRPLKEIFEERTETVGTNTMLFLRDEFKHYNIIFDSDLFTREDWEEELAIDFKVMQELVLQTYNPYQFDVIPLDVLGTIYEQYLGYAARVTDHQVRFELKPELRKAGGVYYTPEYIVDYIVKKTVAEVLRESSATKIKKLRILDPACGSGSFLIRAYEEMLDYYRNQKRKRLKSRNQQRRLDLKHDEGERRLTIHEKSEILRRHIFGVDIDEQAVGVTKLSLMLKMLEDESGIIPGRSILPMLDRNIRCGNSLVSGDILELKKYFGEDWYKAKPFNWGEEFRKILSEDGGFDVVIGNPPYVVLEDLFRDEKSLGYFRSKYHSSSYKIDTYHLFFERGIGLLKKGGVIGFISPSNYLTNNALSGLRLHILNKCTIGIINVIEGKVFPGASVDTSVSVFRKGRSRGKSVLAFSEWRSGNLHEKTRETFAQKAFLDNPYYLFTSTTANRITVDHFPLGKRFLVKFGMQLRDRKKYLGDVIKENQHDLLTKFHRKCYTGRNINRYHLRYSGLLAYVNREAKRGGCWDQRVHESNPKILVRQIGKSPVCAIDEEGLHCLNTLFMILPQYPNEKLSLRFLLGIMNSRFISSYWQKNFYDMRQTFPKIKGTYLKELPIPTIDFSEPSERRMHDDLVALVSVVLNLNEEIYVAKGDEQKQIQRQIVKTDKEIDDLVYRLYGLTEEEQRMIEQVK